MDKAGYLVQGASVTWRTPKSYAFTPKEDITAYELAILMPAFLGGDPYWIEDFLAKHPELVRHVTETK